MDTLDGDYDLLVIGGGINGVGVARDAAGRGIRVALCDRGDLGGATSMASSKLIHGGLRYLEQRQWRPQDRCGEIHQNDDHCDP